MPMSAHSTRRYVSDKKKKGIFLETAQKNEATSPNAPPKLRAFQMILDEANNNARNQG